MNLKSQILDSELSQRTTAFVNEFGSIVIVCTTTGMDHTDLDSTETESAITKQY